MITKPLSIALIAHDNLKPTLAKWSKKHQDRLKRHKLCATGTTGGVLEKEAGLQIEKLKSGPLGGDLQIGGRIAQGEIDWLVFFWDPMSPHSHDVDVKALLRIAVVYNVAVACNQATADLMIELLPSS